MRTDVARGYTFREEAEHKPARHDSREDFTDNLNALYQLSFLLTRDHEKAQRCLMSSFKDSRRSLTFSEWVRSWQKRVVIENAIRELRPRPTRSHPSSSLIAFSYAGRLSNSPNGHFKLEAILALDDFERFVFVISMLEHYSDHYCAKLLGYSVLEIREARTSALSDLINSIQMVFPRNQVFTQEQSNGDQLK